MQYAIIITMCALVYLIPCILQSYWCWKTWKNWKEYQKTTDDRLEKKNIDYVPRMMWGLVATGFIPLWNIVQLWFQWFCDGSILPGASGKETYIAAKTERPRTKWEKIQHELMLEKFT